MGKNSLMIIYEKNGGEASYIVSYIIASSSPGPRAGFICQLLFVIRAAEYTQ
jgi:hypothetical protein